MRKEVTESYYNELYQYTKANVISKRQPLDIVEDILHEAILYSFDKNIDAKKAIVIYIREYIRSNRQSHNIDILNNDNNANEYKYCFKCKKPKQRDDFGISNVYRYNNYYVNSYCKECVRLNVKRWYSQNKKRKQEYRKKWKRLQREKLTDCYIKDLLFAKYGWANITPKMIKQKRQEILYKRLTSNNQQ